MDNTYTTEVRRAMTVVLLSTDPNDSLMLHSVRVLEKFVSDSLDRQAKELKAADGLINIIMADQEKPKRLGVSLITLDRAEKFLRSGFKSRAQIANYLGITTDTVKTKVMPNIRRRCKVERERFGVTGRYKYRIA